MYVVRDLIPVSPLHRPGIKMEWQYITVHNTGNPKSNAANERNWLTNPANTRQASWHYVIFEDQIIQAIPENEVAWHAGDGRGDGNMRSIGIEICESGDFQKSKETAAKFIAEKLFAKKKGVNSVKQHFDWSGKDCPRKLRPIWPSFMAMIKKELDILNSESKKKEEVKKDWRLDGLRYLHEQGIVKDFDGWLEKIDQPLPAWAVFTILAELAKKK